MSSEDELGARIAGLHRSLRDSEDDARFLALGVALGVGLLVLSATSWLVRVKGTTRGASSTAWDLSAAEGWVGTVALVLVVTTAVAALVALRRSELDTRVHVLLAGVAALSALWAIVVVAVLDDDYHTAPGLWLSMLAAAALTVVHLARAETVIRRDR